MLKSLFHKDYTIMIIGQIISIFGNSILRFALSLYVLDCTGSAGIFATILALSLLPTILCSPIGGMLADRMSRKHMMVILDFTTAFLLLLFLLYMQSFHVVTIIAIFMIILSLIQSFYQPAVQASIPLLCSQDQLVAANSIVVQINALANLAGPILGGIFYGFFDIRMIAFISMLCFTCSAILEIFLTIPFYHQPKTTSLTLMMKQDMREAITFILHENPAIFKMLWMLGGLNFVMTAMLQVGLPYIIKIQLQLSSQHYGFAESSLAIGTILGSFYAAKHAANVNISSSYQYLFFGSLAMLPIGLAIISLSYANISYLVIVLAILCAMSFITIFNVAAQTFLQTQTPTHLLGKVSSYVTTLTMCAIPLGQAIYGICFDVFNKQSYLIVLLACFCSCILAYYAKQVLLHIKEVTL